MEAVMRSDQEFPAARVSSLRRAPRRHAGAPVGPRIPRLVHDLATLGTPLLACLLLALTAPVALGGGLSLNWGTVCYTEAPASLRTFACDTNTGVAGIMTVSFKLDSTMSDMIGVEWTIEGESSTPTVPDWWQLGDAADCRADTTFNSDYTVVATPTCADWTDGQGFIAPNYTWSGNKVTIAMGTAIDASAPFYALAGQEYYAGGVTILNRQPAGEGACTGCLAGMRFRLSALTVAGLSGRRDAFAVPMPGGNQDLRWNTQSPTVPTATSLHSQPSPSPLGNVVTLTATVEPDSATGTVTFADATHAFGIATLSGGVATLAVAGLPQGENALTATYGGDFDLYESVSPVLSHTVVPGVPTTVTLTASPSPSIVGHAVLLTATVSPAGASGSVQFRDGAVPLGTSILANGVATMTTAGLALGDHALSVAYAGDGTYRLGQSPVTPHTVVAKIPTTVTMTGSPTPTIQGQAMLLTATVSPADASGSVVFRDGIDWLGTVVLSAGVAQMTLGGNYLSPGSHVLRAYYGGDATHAASTSLGFVHRVNALVSTTTALSVPGSSVLGDSILLTASVSPRFSGGRVSFREVGNNYWGAVAVLNDGIATARVPGLCLGAHSLAADFMQDSAHYTSTSPEVRHVVYPPPATITVTSSLNPSPYSQAVGFTARVSAAAGSPCAVTGTVQFVIDGASLGAPVALANGVATLGGVTGLAVGSHGVRAVYSGNGCAQESTSPILTQVVSAAAPVLVSVLDVPNDQGGQVTLLWSASVLDLPPYDQITYYNIYRSAPSAAVARAGQAGAVPVVERQVATFDWERVDSVPATRVPTYSHVAATPCDSMAGSNPLTAFMIEACAAGSPGYFSNPDSGYSVDNLAPAAPEWFEAQPAAGVTVLRWPHVPAPDLAAYRVYRGASADFVPGPGSLIASPVSEGYRDVSDATCYYKLSAADVHGNEGPYSVTQAVIPADAPQGASFLFALEGVRPNPTTGREFTVRFELPDGAPARLALFDMSGRCVAFREVGAFGAGRHVVNLGGEARFAPGVYVVRLTQGTMSRTGRAVVLR
jgi:hypothetical protein